MNKYAGKHTSTESEGFADSEIQQMTMPEYIDAIIEWKSGL